MLTLVQHQLHRLVELVLDNLLCFYNKRVGRIHLPSTRMSLHLMHTFSRFWLGQGRPVRPRLSPDFLLTLMKELHALKEIARGL